MNAAKECDADEIWRLYLGTVRYDAQVKDSGGLEYDSMNVGVS